MKSQKAIISILAAILVVNIIGVVFVSSESKKQTEIALQTAELEAIQAQLIGYEMEIKYSGMPEKEQNEWIAKEADLRLKNIEYIRELLELPGWKHNGYGYGVVYDIEEKTGYYGK